MEKKYNYSIIIPHHNIPELLERCLKSIPRRNDVQIIVVDDNSTNVDFSRFPGKDDPDIKIIYSKAGKGAGAARNEGIKIATGKWLIFVDADDFLTSDALSIWDRYMHSQSDIIYSRIKSVDCETLEIANKHQNKEKGISRYKHSENKLHRWLRFYYTEPWGKLIRREFVEEENVLFQESIVANDYMFSIKTGYLARNVELIDDVFYIYTVRTGSLSNKQFDNDDKIISRLKVYLAVEQFAENHKIGIYPFSRLVTHFVFRNRHLVKYSDLVFRDYNKSKYLLYMKCFYRTFKFHLISRLLKIPNIGG